MPASIRPSAENGGVLISPRNQTSGFSADTFQYMPHVTCMQAQVSCTAHATRTRRDDVSAAARTARIERGKGGKGHVAPRGTPAARILEQYLRWVGPEVARLRPRERALFVQAG